MTYRTTTKWLMVGEAGRIAGVGIMTIRRWADCGLVRAQRTPGSQSNRVIDEASLRAYLQQRVAEREARA